MEKHTNTRAPKLFDSNNTRIKKYSFPGNVGGLKRVIDLDLYNPHKQEIKAGYLIFCGIANSHFKLYFERKMKLLKFNL